MNIGDFLHSKRWRLIQNYIYSWGASVVLIGALFKLEHLPGAPILLGVGLSIEAIIFFVSAFEPLMELPDWKRVYPQLRTGEEKGKELTKYSNLDKKFYKTPSKTGEGPGLPGIEEEQISRLKESLEKLTQTAIGLSDLSKATEATEGFVKNLNEASSSIETMAVANKNATEKIGQTISDLTENYKSTSETVKTSAGKVSLGIDQSLSELSSAVKSTTESLKTDAGKVSSGISQTLSGLSDTVKSTAENMKGQTDKTSQEMNKTLSDLSGAIKASSEVMKSNADKASSDMGKTVNDLSLSFKANAESLKSNGEKISSDFEKTGLEFHKKLNSSADELASSYKKMTESLATGFKGLEKSAGKYVEGIDKLNKNLAAVNTTYEIHLKGAEKVDEIVKGYSNNVNEIGKLLHTSVEETRKFNDNTKEINESIQALNKIYGRMLGALNNKK